MRYQAYEIAGRELSVAAAGTQQGTQHGTQARAEGAIARRLEQSGFLIKVSGDEFCGRGIQAGDLVAVVKCAERRGGFWMRKLSDSMPVLAWVSAGETMQGAFAGWLRHYANSPAALLG